MSTQPEERSSGADGNVIVALQGFCLDAVGEGGGRLELELSLAAGDALLVHVAHPRMGSLLADACSGLVRPRAGRACFLGHDWSTLDNDDTSTLRSVIGRLFYTANWLDHLDLAHNVLLPLLHHTRRPVETLAAEAARLARDFGLPGLPHGRPGALEHDELQRAGCVRAFLGTPRLIILEHPTTEGYPALLGALVNAMRVARDRGAAVLWISPSEAILRNRKVPFSRRARLIGGRLTEPGTPS